MIEMGNRIGGKLEWGDSRIGLKEMKRIEMGARRPAEIGRSMPGCELKYTCCYTLNGER
jgi:hypothetical protein